MSVEFWESLINFDLQDDILGLSRPKDWVGDELWINLEGIAAMSSVV